MPKRARKKKRRAPAGPPLSAEQVVRAVEAAEAEELRIWGPGRAPHRIDAHDVAKAAGTSVEQARKALDKAERRGWVRSRTQRYEEPGRRGGMIKRTAKVYSLTSAGAALLGGTHSNPRRYAAAYYIVDTRQARVVDGPFSRAEGDAVLADGVRQGKYAHDTHQLIEGRWLGEGAFRNRARANIAPPGPGYILVDVEQDRLGSLLVHPKSEKVKRQMRAHTEKWTGHPDDSVYIQVDYEVDTFLDRYVPRRKHSEVRGGWPVTVKMDPWEFGHYVGYDFHEVIRP